MPPRLITFVRHGQARHNVNQEFHILDPLLTPLGEAQCRRLSVYFPFDTSPINLIVTSPFKRTLQTTILAFGPHLKSSSPPPVICLPLLRETRRNPCDYGSPVEEVEPFVKEYSFDWSIVKQHPGWIGDGDYWGLSEDGLKERGKAAREWLWSRNEDHIVVVGHGAFVHYLTDIFDTFPGRTTGWLNCEARQYQLVKEGASGDVRMVRIKNPTLEMEELRELPEVMNEKVEVVVNEVELAGKVAVVA